MLRRLTRLREQRSRNHDPISPAKIGHGYSRPFRRKRIEELRAVPGSCACGLLHAPFSAERISGICSLPDSDAVDEVRSHGAERLASPILIRVNTRDWLSWPFQFVFPSLHRVLFGGGGNSAVPVGFTRIPLPNGCGGVGCKLVARPAHCHPV